MSSTLTAPVAWQPLAGHPGETTAAAPTSPAACVDADPGLFFADDMAQVARAKQVCATCPVREQCLAGALERAEPHGVWGGELFEAGRVIARKRPRGRPRKHPLPSEGGAVEAGRSREKAA